MEKSRLVLAVSVLLIIIVALIFCIIPSAEEEYVGISLLVEYEDGTTKTFKSDATKALTISDTGGKVKAVTAAVTISATHTAPSTKSWSVEGSWTVQIFQGATKIADMGAPDAGPATLLYGHYAPTANFISGQKYTINEGTIRYNAATIESALSGRSYGSYTMVFKTTLTLSLGFPDGTSDYKTGTAQTNWDFAWSSSYKIQSLSVSIYNGQIR